MTARTQYVELEGYALATGVDADNRQQVWLLEVHPGSTGPYVEPPSTEPIAPITDLLAAAAQVAQLQAAITKAQDTFAAMHISKYAGDPEWWWLNARAVVIALAAASGVAPDKPAPGECDDRAPMIAWHDQVYCTREHGHRGPHRNGEMEWRHASTAPDKPAPTCPECAVPVADVCVHMARLVAAIDAPDQPAFCEHSGLTVHWCKDVDLCDCFDQPNGDDDAN